MNSTYHSVIKAIPYEVVFQSEAKLQTSGPGPSTENHRSRY